MINKKILLITTTHLAKNPRLVKEISALKAIYKVEVLFFQTLPEYVKFDKLIIKAHPEVKFHTINWLHRYYSSRFFYTLLQKILILSHKISDKIIFPEQQLFSGYLPLLKKAKELNFDVIHGHNPGALAVACNAAKYKKALSGFDTEDFHRGEYIEAHPIRPLVIHLENKYFRKIDLLFTASPLINQSYKKLYPGITLLTINNAFPSKEFISFKPSKNHSLKMVWFSQVIGHDRGLAEVIQGIKDVETCTIELYLYGECEKGIQLELQNGLNGTRHRIEFKGTVSNLELNQNLNLYDVGIAAETGHTENRNICLTNKIFAYTQAGLAILASDTPAQEKYLKTYPGIGELYLRNDSNCIKSILEKWSQQPESLQLCKSTSAKFALTEINWEKESEKLLSSFKHVLETRPFKKLKIALTVDPEIPVPPRHYGGIERIVNILVLNFTAAGHEVTLFANKESKVPCRLVGWQGSKSRSLIATIKNAAQLLKAHQKHQFDVIHSFGRLAYLTPLLTKSVVKIMSYQREPTLSQIRKAKFLAQKNSLFFTGCSNYISNQINLLHPAKTIYNAVDTKDYLFNPETGTNAPLIFLGRIEEIKGTHLAIELAQKTGHSLIIAGNIPEKEITYFEKKVKPHLNDKITYVGPVDDLQKNDLLGKSLALLMPILWDEPFGIVIIEAMACGTPVIGLKRGALPEIVKDGINGFICDNLDEMEHAINKIDLIDRQKVRLSIDKNYSSSIMVNAYLHLYQQLLKTP